MKEASEWIMKEAALRDKLDGIDERLLRSLSATIEQALDDGKPEDGWQLLVQSLGEEIRLVELRKKHLRWHASHPPEEWRFVRNNDPEIFVEPGRYAVGPPEGLDDDWPSERLARAGVNGLYELTRQARERLLQDFMEGSHV